MTIRHSVLTGDQLHEPKDVSGASAGEFNLASSGATNWTNTYGDDVVAASSTHPININDLGEYISLTLCFNELLVSASQIARLGFSSDNGSNIIALDYYTSLNENGTSEYASVTSYIPLSPSGASSRLNGYLTITGFNKARKTMVKGTVFLSSSSGLGGTTTAASIIAVHNANTALNALRLYLGSGSFTSGRLSVQGIKG